MCPISFFIFDIQCTINEDKGSRFCYNKGMIDLDKVAEFAREIHTGSDDGL